jgi:hypothetical protein
VRHDEIEHSIANRQRVHWRFDEPHAIGDAFLNGTIGSGPEHRPRQIRSNNFPPACRERHCVPACPTPDVEQEAGPCTLTGDIG